MGLKNALQVTKGRIKQSATKLKSLQHDRRKLVIAAGMVCAVAIAVPIGIARGYRDRGSHKPHHTPVATESTQEGETLAKRSKKPSKPAQKPAAPVARTGLAWEWNATKPIAGYWKIATPAQPVYNDEAQTYMNRSQNVRVEKGALVLEARKEGSKYTSGWVDTKGLLAVEAGSRLEATIKLPKGKGTWPAFWLLSTSQPHTTLLKPTNADWEQERFYMHDGEIDIMEAYGNYPGMVEATVNAFKSSPESPFQKLGGDPNGFHTYALDWKTDELVFSVDGNAYFSYKKTSDDPKQWPFTASNKMYVILNLAMGGSGGGKITPAAGDSWRMEISSVKYYK